MNRSVRWSVSSDSSRKRSARVKASSTLQPITFRSVDDPSRGCRSTLTRTLGRRRRCGADHLQAAHVRAHPLAADVDVRAAVVHAGDNTFQSEAAHDHTVADDGRTRRRRRRGGRRSTGCSRRSTTSSTARVAAARAAPALPVLTTWRAAASCASVCVCRFSAVDHAVDLAARLPDLRLELLAQPPAEGLLALPQPFLALLHARRGLRQRLTLARREPALVLERAHVAVDLGQVIGQLRFARAQIAARAAAITDGTQAEARGDLQRQAAARRAVNQFVGRARTSRR